MKIRHAQPEDASFLAKAILIAGRAHVEKGIWEVILGGTEKECLDFLQHLSVTYIPHLFHYSYYFIAEQEGNGPIGSLGGYNPLTSGYQFLQKAIPEVVRKLNLPAQPSNESEEHTSKIISCIPKEVDGAWVVDSMAIMPEHRGKGAAEALLNHVLEKGKTLGHRKAQVNVYIGNEPALNLYYKFGFEIIEENRDEYFEKNIGSPGMLSLVRNL